MKNLKVALLQLMPEDTLDGNIQKGLKYCRKSKEMGADIALFPEMWSVGYNIPEDIAELKVSAVFADSAFVNTFSNLAKDLNMAIGITFLEKFDPLPRNTLCLFDRFGNKILTYAKVHTCDFDWERYLESGDGFHVCKFDGICIGVWWVLQWQIHLVNVPAIPVHLIRWSGTKMEMCKFRKPKTYKHLLEK